MADKGQKLAAKILSKIARGGKPRGTVRAAIGKTRTFKQAPKKARE